MKEEQGIDLKEPYLVTYKGKNVDKSTTFEKSGIKNLDQQNPVTIKFLKPQSDKKLFDYWNLNPEDSINLEN